MSFAEVAERLAGVAGARLGWTPDQFWRATPAELGSVARALMGDVAVLPPTRKDVSRLMEMFPDG